MASFDHAEADGISVNQITSHHYTVDHKATPGKYYFPSMIWDNATRRFVCKVDLDVTAIMRKYISKFAMKEIEEENQPECSLYLFLRGLNSQVIYSTNTQVAHFHTAQRPGLGFE
jgi:hypothetical protein